MSESPSPLKKEKGHMFALAVDEHPRLARVAVVAVRNCSDDGSKYGDQGDRND